MCEPGEFISSLSGYIRTMTCRKRAKKSIKHFFAPFPFIQLLCVYTLKYNNGIESEDENFTKSARLSTSDD